MKYEITVLGTPPPSLGEKVAKAQVDAILAKGKPAVITGGLKQAPPLDQKDKPS